MAGEWLAFTFGPEWIVLALFLIPYWLPTIIAVTRKVPSVGSVVAINLLLGWTIIGWVFALSMALRSAPTSPPGR